MYILHWTKQIHQPNSPNSSLRERASQEGSESAPSSRPMSHSTSQRCRGKAPRLSLNRSERPPCCCKLCISRFARRLKVEQMMKYENTSDDVPTPSMSAHQHENGSDSLPLASPTTVPQEAPAQAHPPRMERWLTPRHRMGLLLVVMVVVLLVALVGGYSLFRVVAQPSR